MTTNELADPKSKHRPKFGLCIVSSILIFFTSCSADRHLAPSKKNDSTQVSPFTFTGTYFVKDFICGTKSINWIQESTMVFSGEIFSWEKNGNIVGNITPDDDIIHFVMKYKPNNYVMIAPVYAGFHEGKLGTFSVENNNNELVLNSITRYDSGRIESEELLVTQNENGITCTMTLLSQ